MHRRVEVMSTLNTLRHRAAHAAAARHAIARQLAEETSRRVPDVSRIEALRRRRDAVVREWERLSGLTAGRGDRAAATVSPRPDPADMY